MKLTRYLKLSIRLVILCIVVWLALFLGIKLFSNTSKHSAELIGSGHLGLVSSKNDHHFTNDTLRPATLNSKNVLLKKYNFLMHFRLRSGSEDSVTVKIYLPELIKHYDIAYIKDFNFTGVLHSNFKDVKSGYIELDSVQLHQNDYCDIWVVFNSMNYDSLEFLSNLRNYHFLLSNGEKVNISTTISYYEESNSFYSRTISSVIERPYIQGLLLLFTIWGVWEVFNGIKKILFYKRTKLFGASIWRRLNLVIPLFILLLCIYNLCNRLGSNDKIEISQFDQNYIPALPIYDVLPDSFDIFSPADIRSHEVDFNKAYSIPVRFRIDTLCPNCCYSQTYWVKTPKEEQLKELTIVTTTPDSNKYFAQWKNGSLEKFDASVIFSGVPNQDSIQVFSNVPVKKDELEFHMREKVYKTRRTKQILFSYNSVDHFLTGMIINSFPLQMIILYFVYFGCMGFIKKLFRALSIRKDDKK